MNEQWLATGEGDIYEENTSIKTYKIPVYYPDQLKLFYRSNQKDKINTNDYLLTTTAYPNKTIGIYITETHFSPKFEVSDMLAFEQIKNFQDGEILLIYLAKANNIVVKYAFHAGEDLVLISPTEKPMKLSYENGDIIIGAYRECLKKTRAL